MRRGIHLALLGVLVSGAVVVTTGGAQVYPVRLDEQEPQPAAAPVPSLVLADGGLEFPDGTVQATAAVGAAPPCFDASHRFVDCGNGTVTDTVTGLIWLENANCFGAQEYAAANQIAALLFDGATFDPEGGDCDLTDGSRAGDWRLPTKEEWTEILKASCEAAPKIVGNLTPTPGCYADVGGEWASGVVSSFYWSATTFQSDPTLAWDVSLASGNAGGVAVGKDVPNGVWPFAGLRSTRRFSDRFR